MPTIALWSWELGPDLSSAKAREAYREVLRCDPCSYCGALDSKHADHIVPRSAGGEDEWSNLTAACASCNMGKRISSVLGLLLREPVGAKHARWLDRQERTRRWMANERAERLAA